MNTVVHCIIRFCFIVFDLMEAFKTLVCPIIFIFKKQNKKSINISKRESFIHIRKKQVLPTKRGEMERSTLNFYVTILS